MKETDIDCMKYRKSTHIAGVDVDMIIAEKGKCILTIKEAFYDKGVDVSGNKTDGYFLEFNEDVKPMVVNSGNRGRIANMVRVKNQCTAVESRNIGNWKGLPIELLFDENVKMMGKKTGGIVVSPVSPIVEKEELTPKHIRWEDAKKAFKSGKKSAVIGKFKISDENIKKLEE